jgi:DedD protein
LQDQLKERLTGAAILVVIVVFAVPEMFHGHAAAPGTAEAPAGAAIPLRTYTIDLAAGPAAQPMPRDTGDAAAPVEPAPVAPMPATSSPAASDAATQHLVPAPSSQAVTGVIQRPEPAPAPTPAVAPPVAPAIPPPAAAAPRHEQAPPQKAPQPVAKAPDKALASGWAVQVGSFRNRDLAERMTHQVRAKGFAVQMVGPDAKGLYRVRSALLADRAAAAALRERMAGKGLKPIINSSP